MLQQAEGPSIIVGDINGDPDDFKSLADMVANSGWTDIGAAGTHLGPASESASCFYNVVSTSILYNVRPNISPRVSRAPPSCATCCLSQCASILFLQRREHLHLVQRAPPYFTTCFSCTSICVLSLRLYTVAFAQRVVPSIIHPMQSFL